MPATTTPLISITVVHPAEIDRPRQSLVFLPYVYANSVGYSLKEAVDSSSSRYDALLEYAFQETNHIDGTQFIDKRSSKTGERFRSTSVGDIMIVNEAGRPVLSFMVDSMGFKQLSDAQAKKLEALPFRDRSMGYAWLDKKGML